MNSAGSEECKFPLFATIRRLFETCWAHFGPRCSNKDVRHASTQCHDLGAFGSRRVKEFLQFIAGNPH